MAELNAEVKAIKEAHTREKEELEKHYRQEMQLHEVKFASKTEHQAAYRIQCLMEQMETMKAEYEKEVFTHSLALLVVDVKHVSLCTY